MVARPSAADATEPTRTVLFPWQCPRLQASLCHSSRTHSIEARHHTMAVETRYHALVVETRYHTISVVKIRYHAISLVETRHLLAISAIGNDSHKVCLAASGAIS